MKIFKRKSRYEIQQGDYIEFKNQFGTIWYVVTYVTKRYAFCEEHTKNSLSPTVIWKGTATWAFPQPNYKQNEYTVYSPLIEHDNGNNSQTT